MQGRGSAANSAVCYALGITAVDPVGMDLLFERFLSEERGEWPDIDLDLPSGDQRERAIQYVYQRYGKLGAAMTANVITYRGRSAAREIGKALGFEPETLDRLASLVGAWEYKDANDTLERQFHDAGFDLQHPLIRKFFDLCLMVQDLPRHLGQHSGGMVICQGQLDSVVPLEPATMPGRVVVQWDKEDCADMGIVKVDLLGLGMMAVLEESLQLIREDYGEEVDLAHLPRTIRRFTKRCKRPTPSACFRWRAARRCPACRACSPTCFYDIVVQVAIIRPGPIVGKMVHPYLKRRQGREPPNCLHPSLEPVLARTLGVPLFQEQLLRMAMIAAGFTGGEAEELRRALGFKRSEARMHDIEIKLRAGMERNGIDPGDAGQDRAIDHVVRAVWISGIARREFRADRLCQRVSEMPLSGRVHRGDAEQPADGFLSSGHAGEGRAAAWAEIQADRCDVLGLAVHAREKTARDLLVRAGHALRERPARRNRRRKSCASAPAAVSFHRRFEASRAGACRNPNWRRWRRSALEFHCRQERDSHRRDALWQIERVARRAGPLLENRGRGNSEAAELTSD